MRLDRELGTLNREIIAIKEKWKIALNIDSKKVAIEKLITRRKKMRDSGAVLQMVEDAIEEERRIESLNVVSSSNSPKPQEDVAEIKKKPISAKILEAEKTEDKIEEKSSSEEPVHLTVSWLKNRMRDR